MRSRLSRALHWMRSRTFLHPPSAVFVQLLDGKLDPVYGSKVHTHLSRCGLCRERLEQFQEGLDIFDHLAASWDPGFSLEHGLERLTSAIEAHSVAAKRREFSREALPAAVYEQLLSELSIYVGRRTAERLLERCSRPARSRDEVTAVIRPVIAAFLGEQAGSAVTTNVLRIWDRSIS